MMIITEISLQKRNKKRCNVYVDGNFYCALDNFTVIKNRLKNGVEITAEELGNIQAESEKDKALTYAFDYISKYVKTEKQLRDKLYEKGYLTETVEYVMAKVKEYKYVDDETYANSYLESAKTKYGAKMIKYELKRKGVADNIIEKIEFNEEDEKAAATAVAEKFFSKNEVSRENLNKLYNKLALKGFSYDVIGEVVADLRNADREN